jgi:hypothetical protein
VRLHLALFPAGGPFLPSLSVNVFPATVMSHTLYTFACLRLIPHHLGAHLCRSVTLAVEDPDTCKLGCFINHGAEVAPRGELAQVDVNTMQFLNLLRWTRWVGCAAHLAYHTRLTNLSFARLHKGCRGQRTAL